MSQEAAAFPEAIGELGAIEEAVVPEATYAGKIVTVNKEGFFEDPSEWDEAMVPEIARSIGFDELGDAHWRIIRSVRDEYLTRGSVPGIRALGKLSGVPLKEVWDLFPCCPAKYAAKMAGIPKPRGCV